MKGWIKERGFAKSGVSTRFLLCGLFVLTMTACSSENSTSTDSGTTTTAGADTSSGADTGSTAGSGTDSSNGTGTDTTTGNATTDGGNTAGTGTTTGTDVPTTDDGDVSANILGPLPSPPLTEPPSQNDEPLPAITNSSTATDIQLVRDPGDRIPKPIEAELTDADFAAGPLPEEVFTPDNVDPSINSAPTFEGLSDVEAVAGEILEIIYKPIDADGDLPGMYPEELPIGASFDDNFNGTKTFRWQPLQMDVGVNEFTVVALDAKNNQYRTKRTIRIRVSLPADVSTIPNVAPVLDEFVLHTVRANDPVVLELKGIDYNGTVPFLELVSALPEASFFQHPRYEEIYVLRFIPKTIGTLNIQILARDSIDSSLTTTNTVTLKVLPESDFIRSGERLRELAAARNIQFGYASLPFYYQRPDGGLYASTAASEFNLVTPENSMKMDAINPLPNRYEFADIDNLISFAKQNNMAVHGHPVIWHRQLPDWILNVNPAELRGHMREYIDRLISRYSNDITIWDAVNEPIGDNGGYRDSIWFQAMGKDYIDVAFHQARVSDPDATLLLNDFDIAFNGPKADSLFSILDDLIERDIPIDGVGFQLHIFSSFDQFNEVRENFQKVADRGLDIYITEFDVALNEGDSLSLQADVYKSIVALCVEQPRCKAIQTWGFTDQYSFREIFRPLMFDKDYLPKPAYEAIRSALR